MQNTARFFNCARCRRQVVICRRCDRGNIYCGKQCSQPARRESLRAAARRYQASKAGRFKHAERQRRYRSRSQKVTHQGSPASLPDGSLRGESRTVARRNATLRALPVQGLRCQFCKRPCSPFLRLDFLRSPGPRLTSKPMGLPPPDS